MNAIRDTIEVRNQLWPGGEQLSPPDQCADAFWRDTAGRPYALPELLAGTDDATGALLLRRHLVAITSLLDESLSAGSPDARTIRHRARRLIGEIDGWWVEQAREVRDRG